MSGKRTAACEGENGEQAAKRKAKPQDFEFVLPAELRRAPPPCAYTCVRVCVRVCVILVGVCVWGCVCMCVCVCVCVVCEAALPLPFVFCAAARSSGFSLCFPVSPSYSPLMCCAPADT